MTTNGIDIDGLEALWTALADRITAAGAEGEAVFLTKFAILLANEVGDYDRVARCLELAAVDQRPRGGGR